MGIATSASAPCTAGWAWSQASALQISARSTSPVNTTSLSNPAKSRSACGIRIRPCASGFSSLAVARKYLRAFRTAGSTVDIWANPASTVSFQVDNGNSQRFPSRPRVTTQPALSKARKSDGSVTRPLSSSVYRCSPRNNPVPLYFPSYPVSPTGPHTLPLSPTEVKQRGGIGRHFLRSGGS
jgi:hypothetical protein